jgi:hypothetical protein
MSSLIASLKNCILLLDKHKEEFWSNKLRSILNSIEVNGTTSNVVDRLLGLFGGMGSFSDLLIMKVNDHYIEEREEDKVNKKLSVYREQIYKEANNLKPKQT